MISLDYYFPTGYLPNKQQSKILKEIGEAIDQEYKYIIISAPTGSGKSHVAKTISNFADHPSPEFVELIRSNLAFKRKEGMFVHELDCLNQSPFGAMVLTITKTLQDQYNTLFPDIVKMKGKNNYTCAVDEEFPVDMAPCLFVRSMADDCIQQHKCPYYNVRADALTAKIASLNYKMYFSLPEHVKQRQFLICDEAAELEDELVKHFTCEITFDILTKIGVEYNKDKLFDAENYADYRSWASHVYNAISERISDITDILQDNKISKIDANRNKKYLRVLFSYKTSIETLIDTYYESDYQIELRDDAIKYIPLKVNKLSNHLFSNSNTVILMSATIIDVEHYCKSLGIENFKYIEVDSPFDPKKAPILFSSKYKLNYKNIDQTLPLVMKQVEDIINHHKDEKGIIHTHSNKITQAVRDHFMFNKRFLFRDEEVTNEHILEEHNNSPEATILVSPSMSHGVDLKGDLAKFQIILKAPFLPLGDVRVKRMFELDKVWYTNKMLGTIIQACGRGVRSKNDECITYILDGSITSTIKRMSNKIPKYFKQRFY